MLHLIPIVSLLLFPLPSPFFGCQVRARLKTKSRKLNKILETLLLPWRRRSGAAGTAGNKQRRDMHLPPLLLLLLLLLLHSPTIYQFRANVFEITWKQQEKESRRTHTQSREMDACCCCCSSSCSCFRGSAAAEFFVRQTSKNRRKNEGKERKEVRRRTEREISDRIT